MGLFRYEAVDKSGRVLHGAMDARDEGQVRDKLMAMGYTAKSVFAAGGAAPTTSTQSVAVQKPAVSSPQSPKGGIQAVTIGSGVPVSVKSIVAAPTLARFFRHMATLVRSGMPIGQALNDMAPVVRNSRLSVILGHMKETTQGGQKLSTLMAEYPQVFPVHAIASIWAGELAGRLEIALDEVAVDLEQEAADTRFGRIGWGITKANWLFFVACFPLANLTSLLVPVLKQCLDSAGQMSSGAVLKLLLQEYMQRAFWPTVLACGGFGVLWIVWGVMKRVPSIRYTLDRLLLFAPLWGKFHSTRAKGRFLHVLDGLIAAGISPDAAWDAASLVPRNSYIAHQLRAVRARLGSSAGISQLLAASGVFEMEDIGLVQSGERAGTLPDVLANLSMDYNERIAALKTSGKAAATTIMFVFGLLLSVYIMIITWSSYGDLATKAAQMMGQ